MSFPIPLMGLTIAEIVVGSVLVFVVIPSLVFPRLSVDEPDQWMARAALMLAWVMLVGYLLAALHLFSAVALLALMGVTGWFLRRRAGSRYVLSGGSRFSAALYDFLSQTLNWRRAAGRAADRAEQLGAMPRAHLPKRVGPYLWTALTLVVLGSAAWLRFSPNWHHAALFFSDAYETVQWVKGIDVGQLFPTGIYPMGYYIVMAALQTLLHANAVVFVKFFGAFIGTLLTASVMWSTYRFSGRAVPALLAGAVYGLLIYLMPYDGARQLAAEGQEFGNMLVLPVAWLVFQAWVTKKHGYVVASSALLTAVGLTHPIALINAALAAVAATLGAWVVSGVAGRILKPYLWMVPLAAVLVVAPLAIAYLHGIPLLASSTSFIDASGRGSLPQITLMVWVALGGIFALFVTKLLWYDELWEMGLPATAFLLLAFAEAIVQLPRIGINTAALTTRAGEFLALAEALSIGLGAAAVQEAVERIGVRRPWAAGGALLAAGLSVGFLLRKDPPVPFAGYTVSTDEYVAEYVHIERNFPRMSWLTVAYNGYALAVNAGYQYDPSFWTSHVVPDTTWPKFHGLSAKPTPVSQRYIFFFVPRNVVRQSTVAAAPGAVVAGDEQQAKMVLHWVKAWQRLYGPMHVYYRGPLLTVYELSNPRNPI